ncbi:YwqG family protein [Fusobacterium polymorphum]|uniref:YwqG family protein n=1 Tax=Fusobacterium nucleatum subsp. polymorphum TaxID=76857 RepID=UPI003CC60663
MLYFFYELETQEWGYELKNKGCAKVFYYEDISNFSLIDFPENMEDDYKIPEFKVNFKSNISLPSYEDFYLFLKEHDTFKEQDISFSDFIPLYDELFIPDNNYTKLLGYPEVIQNPMEEECEAVTRGFDMGGVESYPKKYQKEIRSTSKDWILLFQMDTVETNDYELMFGDSGHIYFWIKKEDLKNKNFEDIWLILQCY